MPGNPTSPSTSAEQKPAHKTKKRHRCLTALHATDARAEKQRIEELQGGLLKEAYTWILNNAVFQEWRHGDDSQIRMLWVTGDAGKGKTMGLCGIIDELQKSDESINLLYFFCQAGDERVNSATAVLRGWLYLLMEQQPSLIPYVCTKYQLDGRECFEGANAWVALSKLFTAVLQDERLKETYLVIDGLDECTTDLPKLLDFIHQTSQLLSPLKFIILSRYSPEIYVRLPHATRLNVERYKESISAAVGTLIKHEVSELTDLNNYDENTCDCVLEYLASNANATFLWVALVCRNLREVPQQNIKDALGAFPPGLDSLYRRAIVQIGQSCDNDLCKRVMASVATAYRPVTMRELVALVDDANDDQESMQESVQEIVRSCSSFLVVREDTVYFVHQSAKDFLIKESANRKLDNETCTALDEEFYKAFDKLFPPGWEDATHYNMFARSLQIMSQTLHRDMYDLKEPGYLAEQIRRPDPDPLAAARYACSYWIDHLDASQPLTSPEHTGASLQDEGAVHDFLTRKYLYWLEALSLIKDTPRGVESMAKLQTLVSPTNAAAAVSPLHTLVDDAHHFITSHAPAISHAPLQAYASALVFSPATSPIRTLYASHHAPRWVSVHPAVPATSWPACVAPPPSWSDCIISVARSPDSTARLIATASTSGTIQLWDAAGSGERVRTLSGYQPGGAELAVFSPDSTLVASASPGDMSPVVKIWDARSGACVRTLEQAHSSRSTVRALAFAPDATLLASGGRAIRIWDVAGTGECVRTLAGHESGVTAVAFSPDATRLASGSWDRVVAVWDAASGERLRTMEGHGSSVLAVAWAADGARLASTGWDGHVRVWDAGSGACLQVLYVGQFLHEIAFGDDGTGGSSCVRVDIGTIALDAPSSSSSLADDAGTPPSQQRARFRGVGLAPGGEWITYENKPVLWLPAKYRPARSTVSGNDVAVGTRGAELWIFRIVPTLLDGK
ncbi:Vegetative incompatibility protein HET-E-1 [Lasiodiplodia hormozganensis]|uniref:Vegetative incompatibility protein HET-E-1 n=1 Tax=Lasiodiplodia hormozganensis TaxID=869390 RepID=A0AA39XYF1_9PEZI|nr:Vegetative incompatibility protein HET-E-1 [Lasiodiplodia hormozganensis]